MKTSIRGVFFHSNDINPWFVMYIAHVYSSLHFYFIHGFFCFVLFVLYEGEFFMLLKPMAVVVLPALVRLTAVLTNVI